MEIVMPDGSEPSPEIAKLREAYARRLLRKLAVATRGAPLLGRLAELSRIEPAALFEILLDPTVAVSIECGDPFAALRAVMLSLAAAHMLDARTYVLPARSTVWSMRANLLIRGHGALALENGVAHVDGEAIALDGDERALRRTMKRPFPALHGDVRFALFDPNPLALDETHPEKDGNVLSLGGVPLATWRARLSQAFELVERHMPAIAKEMRTMLALVIPVGVDDERHFSASYAEYVGALYLTLHPDLGTMAEALVHEFQHNKLNLLAAHYTVLENGYDELYRSPVRPDARPLMGILLAAHAFVPVAELHRRLIETEEPAVDLRRSRLRLRDVIARNDEALNVLSAHGRAAMAGTHVLARLRALHAAHLALTTDLPTDVSHVA